MKNDFCRNINSSSYFRNIDEMMMFESCNNACKQEVLKLKRKQKRKERIKRENQERNSRKERTRGKNRNKNQKIETDKKEN